MLTKLTSSNCSWLEQDLNPMPSIVTDKLFPGAPPNSIITVMSPPPGESVPPHLLSTHVNSTPPSGADMSKLNCTLTVSKVGSRYFPEAKSSSNKHSPLLLFPPCNSRTSQRVRQLGSTGSCCWVMEGELCRQLPRQDLGGKASSLTLRKYLCEQLLGSGVGWETARGQVNREKARAAARKPGAGNAHRQS